MESGRYQPKVSDTHRLYGDTLRKEGRKPLNKLLLQEKNIRDVHCLYRTP